MTKQGCAGAGFLAISRAPRSATLVAGCETYARRTFQKMTKPSSMLVISFRKAVGW
jgi:hypothetical protein